jgi:regulator of sigma E protease
LKKKALLKFMALKQDDTLVEIDGYKVNSIMDVSKFIMLSTDEFIDFVVLRNDIEYKLKVKPDIVPGTDGFGNPIKEKRMVGIRLAPQNIDSINHVKLGPTKAAYYAVVEIAYVSKKTLVMVWGYIQKLWGKGYGDLSQLGGPIKIAEISGKAFGMGILPFISLMVYISISLGLFNLFPIPLLDGGHIALNTIEGLRGKEFNKSTLELTFRIGMTLIISLMIFATFNDLSNNLHKITGYFGRLF